MNRAEVLRCLIGFDRPITQLSALLGDLPWDSSEELATIGASAIAHVLSLYIGGSVSEGDVGQWANLVEGRDDIAFEASREDLIKEIIFELATPEITRQLSIEAAQSILERLSPPM